MVALGTAGAARLMLLLFTHYLSDSISHAPPYTGGFEFAFQFQQASTPYRLSGGIGPPVSLNQQNSDFIELRLICHRGVARELHGSTHRKSRLA